MKTPAAVLMASVLVLSGCPRPQDPPPGASAPEATGPAPATSSAVAPPAATLPLLRGVVILSAEAPRFTPCGETAALEVRDDTDGPLLQAYGELASDQTGEMWLEARGERTEGAVLLRSVERALPVGESDPCDRILPAGFVQAQGNEPFWSIQVNHDGIDLQEPGVPPLQFPLVVPQVEGTKRTWMTEIPSTPPRRLQLVVGPARCKDSMSGAWYGMAAEAVVDGRALTGCAFSGS